MQNESKLCKTKAIYAKRKQVMQNESNQSETKANKVKRKQPK
jgi:hypothetical protein